MDNRGRSDPARRRRTQRHGRERGAWLYLPAEILEQAGFDPSEPPPFYRVWAGKRGGLTIRLYREG